MNGIKSYKKKPILIFPDWLLVLTGWLRLLFSVGGERALHVGMVAGTFPMGFLSCSDVLFRLFISGQDCFFFMLMQQNF